MEIDFPSDIGHTLENSQTRDYPENCTILIPKGNSYCRHKSSARGPRVKVSSEGLSAEIDIPLRSPIQVQTKADVATCKHATSGLCNMLLDEIFNLRAVQHALQ